MQLEDIVVACQEIIDEPSFSAVRRWKSAHPGAKSVGCFPVYSPVELIHAAGMLPVGVIGAGNQIEIAHADSRFQSFVCSIVKSTTELALTGRLGVFDGIVFHSICDPARNLAAVIKRNLPNLEVQYVHFPQNLETSLAVEYLTAEYARLRNAYQEMAGRHISDEDISRSVAAYNRTRALVRELYSFRRQAPHLISAAESYVLVKAGTRLPPEEHERVLSGALAAIARLTRKPKDRIRVIIEGAFCEQPPLELIATIEDAGCHIVDDDFLLGWRWFCRDVTIDSNPLRALAHSYIDASLYSSVKHDLRERKAKHLVEKVRRFNADAVIYLAAKFCEPALFDYPLFKRALEESGIPHMALEFEEKMWVFDSFRSEVETFVESMMFD